MLSDEQKIKYSRKRAKLPEAERWQMDCPVCLKPINPAEDEAEYVKTKRGRKYGFTRSAFRSGAKTEK